MEIKHEEGMLGAPGGIRTPNPRLRRPVLCPVELHVQYRILSLLTAASTSSATYLFRSKPGLEPGYPLDGCL